YLAGPDSPGPASQASSPGDGAARSTSSVLGWGGVGEGSSGVDLEGQGAAVLLIGDQKVRSRLFFLAGATYLHGATPRVPAAEAEDHVEAHVSVGLDFVRVGGVWCGDQGCGDEAGGGHGREDQVLHVSASHGVRPAEEGGGTRGRSLTVVVVHGSRSRARASKSGASS